MCPPFPSFSFSLLSFSAFCVPKPTSFFFHLNFPCCRVFPLHCPEGSCQLVSIKHNDIFFFGFSLDVVWLCVPRQSTTYLQSFYSFQVAPAFLPSYLPSVLSHLAQSLYIFPPFLRPSLVPPHLLIVLQISLHSRCCFSRWAVSAWGGWSRAHIGTLRPYSISRWADTHTHTHTPTPTPTHRPGPELMGWVLINFAASGETSG